MKVNRETDKLSKTLLKRYGHLLSRFTIFETILDSENAQESEIKIVKIYLEELENLK